MNDHHLDDLIIGNPGYDDKEPKGKGLLTIIALVIVVVIAGMILWALLFGPSDTTTPPQASAKPVASPSTRPLDPQMVELDNKIAQAPVASRPASAAPAEQTTLPAESSVPSEAQARPQEEVAKTRTKPKLIIETTTIPSKTSKQTPSKTAATKRPPVSAEKPAKSSTQKSQKVLIKNAGKTVYYVQVGAFKHDPNPRFLQKLKKEGFTFITKTTNDLRRVRVGPYDSYDDAKAALPMIKAKLGIDGMIVKY